MTLTGKIIEIGDLNRVPDFSQLTMGKNGVPKPTGMVILVTRDQLEDAEENLLYKKVKIELVKE
jgi:hypothetical protein